MWPCQRARSFIRSPTQVGGVCVDLSARALFPSVADPSGGCVCACDWESARAPKHRASAAFFGWGSWFFILLADFCHEPFRLNVLKKHSKMASKKESEVQTSEDLIQEVNVGDVVNAEDPVREVILAVMKIVLWEEERALLNDINQYRNNFSR